MNAMAMRPPTLSSSPASAATEAVTAESLGWQLRAALPPLRLHSVSLYDREANVLWLSEGALGPDEHSLVLDAVEALCADLTQNCHQHGMEDGRVAIFLPVRAPKGDLVGLSMILADLKSVSDGVLERMVTPQVRTIMQKIAVLLRGSVAKGTTETVPVIDMPADPAPMTAGVAAVGAGAGAGAGVAAVGAAPVAVVPALTLAVDPAAARSASTAAAPVVASALAISVGSGSTPAKAPTPPGPIAKAPAAKVLPAQALTAGSLTPEAIDDILEFELTPDVARVEAHMPSQAHDAPPVHQFVPTLSSADEESEVESITQEIFILSGDPFEPAVGLAESPPWPSAPTKAVAASTIPAALPAMTPAVVVASPPAPAATGNSKVIGPAITTGTSRVLSAGDPAGMLLEVQPFVKLRPGGRSRRFEVQVRTSARDAAALDAHALQRLLSWLSVNRGAWNVEPTTFTLNLSITTLEDERFPQNVAAALKSHGISAETIGFEIAEPLCMQRRAQVERFINLCDKIGCFVVIDDFSFDSSVLPLLRSKALRLVKIDPKLTGVALKDKMAQALVVAIAQAVKVLGIHCSAKRVESQAAMQWLTAIGCDFAQGPVVSAVQALDSLTTEGATGPG